MDLMKENPLLLAAASVTAVLIPTVMYFTSIGKNPTKVNLTIKKDKPKVVEKFDVKDIEDLANKGTCAFCRCWRSKNWPMCDGSHAKHNKETGDNTGPLLITCPVKE